MFEPEPQEEHIVCYIGDNQCVQVPKARVIGMFIKWCLASQKHEALEHIDLEAIRYMAIAGNVTYLHTGVIHRDPAGLTVDATGVLYVITEYQNGEFRIETVELKENS